MRRVLTSVLAALVIIGLPPTAHAAADPVARGSWSMVPQSKDTNGDGVIDGDGGVPRTGAASREPSAVRVGAGNRRAQPHERLIDGHLSWYLEDAGFPVRLDACRSRGHDYRWTVTTGGRTVARTDWRSLRPGSCARTVLLPEGPYLLTLEARIGPRTARTALTADVRNILVLALGDSYASGEGNPRNVTAWLRRGGAMTPYWDDDACHRSARGAPALAARSLEEASDRTSVTLVHLACSGASVDAGILGPQADAGVATSQVEQAVRILGGRAVDVVLLSIGGNDVGFTSVLESCLLSNACPVSRPRPGPLSGSPTVNAGVQARTAELPADFARIAACLGTGPCLLAGGRTSEPVPLSPTARVLPTLYPDLTRDATGNPCTYLTMTPQDFAWARATILTPEPPASFPYAVSATRTVDLAVSAGSLNGQLAATSRLPGWAPVAGTWSASGDSPGGHGVCAGDEAWVFGLTALSALPSASFHPNPVGQEVLAAAIDDAMRRALAP